MEWTDYTVTRNVDELKDLTFQQAGKVAEMLNEREPTAKIDDLEERLYDSEQEYENLEGDYNDLIEVSYDDQLIKLLSSEFDNPKEADEMIGWWIYETEFGNKNAEVIVGKGENKKQLFLDTPECLYDFLKGEY